MAWGGETFSMAYERLPGGIACVDSGFLREVTDKYKSVFGEPGRGKKYKSVFGEPGRWNRRKVKLVDPEISWEGVGDRPRAKKPVLYSAPIILVPPTVSMETQEAQ
jgi:hypothetical protein